MKVYHYAKLEDWPSIKNGSRRSNGRPGLVAGRRLGQGDEEASRTTACFALLSPEPEEWKNNPIFKDAWSILYDERGALLLEIIVNSKEDQVFVVDWAHMEGFLSGRKDGIPERYCHKSRREAEHAYVRSKIPLSCYLQDGVGYVLPEVILTSHVSLERIVLPEYQPKLEGYLALLNPEERREQLAYHLAVIPSLGKWYKEYLRRQEGSLSSVERR